MKKKYLIKVIKPPLTAEMRSFLWMNPQEAKERAVFEWYTVITPDRDIYEAPSDEIILIKNISNKNVLHFFDKLGEYVQASFSIKESIEKIKRYSRGGYYWKFLQDLYFSIEKGQNIYEAITASQYSKFFSYNQIQMILVWIQTDRLAYVLQALVEEMELSDDIKKDIRSLLITPIFAFVLMGACLGIMFGYVLPNIIKVIGKIDHYPILTQFLINFKDFLFDYKYVLITLAFLIIAMPKLVKIHKTTQYYWDLFLLKIPAVKWVVRVRTYLQIAKILEISTNADFSSKDKLTMLSRWVENSFYREYFKSVISEVSAWKDFYLQFDKPELFSYDLADKIQIGDETQKLAEQMTKYYSKEFKNFKRTIADLKVVISIVVTVVLWGLVLIFVGGIYQLLLSLNDYVK